MLTNAAPTTPHADSAVDNSSRTGTPFHAALAFLAIAWFAHAYGHPQFPFRVLMLRVNAPSRTVT